MVWVRLARRQCQGRVRLKTKDDADQATADRTASKALDRNAAAQRLDPIVNRHGNSAGPWGLLLLGILVVAAATVLVYTARNEIGQPVLLAVMGALAGIGAFFLFVFSLGFIQLSANRRNDEFSQNLVNGMDSGILVTDREGSIIYANRAYGDITGAQSELEISGIEKIFSRNTQAAEAVYRLSARAHEGMPTSEEIRIPDGFVPGQSGARWFRLRARAMSHPSYKDGLTVWQILDVTNDRQAQEIAFRELQNAINYLDHAPAGFFSSSENGEVVYLNATLADWIGVDLALFEQGSLKLSDFLGPQGTTLVSAVKPEENEPKTAAIDVDFTPSSGHSFPVRLYHKVSPSSDGSPGTSRTLVINRLGKEETDSALLDAELRFTRFFNNTPLAIASVSSAGETVRTNAPFMRMFEKSLEKPSSANGVTLESLVQPEDRETIANALKAVLNGEMEEARPVELAMAADRTRYVRFFLSPVDDGVGADSQREGENERVIVYALETTEQRALEDQFAKGQKMQAVGQLAGGVAHDFNNVLTAIIGFSDLLLANHRPSDPSFQDIMNIKENANRAASLVRQLLAFSRRQTLRPQVLQLGEVLSDLRMLLDRLLGEKVTLSVTHGRDLWPVKADLSQLEQVIVNLAVNARDAMPDGGKLTVTTSNLQADGVATYGYQEMPNEDFVLLEVKDEGTGMPREVIEKIFEPFFSTKEVGKGTGLGLSTVYGIVKQTGGFIYPESTVGEGTTFRVFLPRHIPVEKEEPDAAESVVKKDAPRDLTGSATILLVEDEDAVRAFGSRALASRGYEVHEAVSGVEALEILEEYGDEIDLIVSDVVMPEMDGPTLLREVRKKHPDLKFIFVSGYAEEAFAKNLPEEERDRFGFLPKPFSLKQLATTVKEMLDS